MSSTPPTRSPTTGSPATEPILRLGGGPRRGPPPDTVVVVGERIEFEAAQSRAASTLERARRLAEMHPALFIVWDVLALPGRDMRGWPYTERRAAMLDVLAGLPSPSRFRPCRRRTTGRWRWPGTSRYRTRGGRLRRPADEAARAGCSSAGRADSSIAEARCFPGGAGRRVSGRVASCAARVHGRW